MGTPPQAFVVLIDSGSDRTFVPCIRCMVCGPDKVSPPFNPFASSTATILGCASPYCQCGQFSCGCNSKLCTYTQSYAEGSASQGAPAAAADVCVRW